MGSTPIPSAKIRNSNFRQKYGRREAPSVLHSPHKIQILQGFATRSVENLGGVWVWREFSPIIGALRRRIFWRECSNPEFAEPGGFEPPRGFEAPASLAKRYVRPLCHGSFLFTLTYFYLSSTF